MVIPNPLGDGCPADRCGANFGVHYVKLNHMSRLNDHNKISHVRVKSSMKVCYGFILIFIICKCENKANLLKTKALTLLMIEICRYQY